MKKAIKLLSFITSVIMSVSVSGMALANAEESMHHNSFTMRRVNISPSTGLPLDSYGLIETDFLGIYERFDSQPPAIGTNRYWGGATYNFNNYTNAVVEDGVLKLKGVSIEASRYYWAPTTGNLNATNDPHFDGDSVVTFSFMMPQVGYVEQLYRGMFAQVNGSIDTEGGGPYINVLKNDAGTECFVTYGLDPSKKCFTIEPGRWYRLMLIMNKSSKSFDLYIDGRLVADNAGFTNTKDGEIEGGLIYHHFYSNEGEVWYDDYVTYKKLPGKSVYFAEDFSAMTGRIAGEENGLWYSDETIYSNVTNATVTAEDGNAVLTLIPDPVTEKAFVRLGASKGYGYGETIGEKGAAAFKFRSNSDENSAILACMRVDSCSKGMELWLDGNDLYFGRGGVVPRQLLKKDVKAGKWYSVIMVSDFTTLDAANHTGGSCTIYLAEDGEEYECLGTNLRYNWIENNYPTQSGKQINRAFETYVYYDEEHPDRSISYDDIVIYNDVREEVLSSAMQSIFAESSSLSIADKTVSKPASADGTILEWSADGTVISGDDTVNFSEKAEKTYTVSVRTADSTFAAVRNVTISVPLLYEESLTEENGTVTGIVKVNAVAGDGYAGYADGAVVLAVYDNDTDTLVTSSVGFSQGGRASVVIDALTKRGSYTAKLFFFRTIDSLEPLTSATEISFSVE